MPTRFHYTKVEPQHFGLSPAEILMATDAELNSYMGIKKYAPYRKEGKGRNWDAQRSARLKELKNKLKERSTGGAQAVQQAMEKAKQRKGKKERMREKAAAAATAGEGGAGESDGDEDTKMVQKTSKEKRRSREFVETDAAEDAMDQQDDAGEASTKRKRRRHRKAAAAASA